MRPKLPAGMKPADHPDFFRFPAPPGRSRESRIVLDERGRFFNDGVPIDHSGLATAFASWIELHPDDGRFILTNGYDWTYFRVVDAPFLVTHVEGSADGLAVRLSDGSEERLDPDGVALDLAPPGSAPELSSPGTDGLVADDDEAVEVLYARVKGGRFEARFTPRAQAQLVDFLVETEGGVPALEVRGERHRIGSRPRRV